jgi:hypothetical protein
MLTCKSARRSMSLFTTPKAPNCSQKPATVLFGKELIQFPDHSERRLLPQVMFFTSAFSVLVGFLLPLVLRAESCPFPGAIRWELGSCDLALCENGPYFFLPKSGCLDSAVLCCKQSLMPSGYYLCSEYCYPVGAHTLKRGFDVTYLSQQDPPRPCSHGYCRNLCIHACLPMFASFEGLRFPFATSSFEDLLFR